MTRQNDHALNTELTRGQNDLPRPLVCVLRVWPRYTTGATLPVPQEIPYRVQVYISNSHLDKPTKVKIVQWTVMDLKGPIPKVSRHELREWREAVKQAIAHQLGVEPRRINLPESAYEEEKP